MPGKRKKTTPQKSAGSRATLICAAIVLLAGILLLGWMHLSARTVYVRHATVLLRDLPAAFDGTKLLFISDVDLHGTHTPAATTALMRRLSELQPDMLLLGGDYASASLLERLNAGDGNAGRSTERQIEARTAWISALKGFHAPLGKFAVAGEADVSLDQLRSALEASDVRLLEDEFALVERGGARIAIGGLRDAGGEVPGLSGMAAKVPGSECLILLAHNPSAFVGVQTSEASDGGGWVDLMLSGHTHGGQVVLFGKTALALGEYEQKYRSGWRREGGVAQLTSCGLGCTGANLRFGTQAEVHLITLRRGEPPESADPAPWSPPEESFLPDTP